MTDSNRFLTGRLGGLLLLAGALGCGGAPLSYPGEDPGTFTSGPAAALPKPIAPPPQEPKSIDLHSALRLAAGVHWDVLEARARVREAEGRASSADGSLLPVIGGGGAVGHTRGQVQGSFGDLRKVDYGTVNAVGTLRISSNVGESIYRDLAAHRLTDAAAAFETATLQRTLYAVATGYLALVEADGTVRLQEQFLQESQTLARLTQTRETLGLGSALDSERARAQAAAAEQRLLAARNERQRRSKALATALRLDATVDLVPVDKELSPAALVDPAEPLSKWMGRAEEHRAETRALRAAREAFDHEASAARWSAYGPEFAAAGLVGTGGTTFGTLDERESWLVTLGWTFSFGGPGRVETADARSEQAGIALDRFRDQLRASVAGSYQELALSKDQLEPSERELAAAEKALRIAKANFEGGLLPENDLLLAQQGADQARLKRLSAVARFNQSQLRLLAESGVASLDRFLGTSPDRK